MLHILLLILKIIGIIIAAILGILVLFLCIIFFVPVRYEIQGKCDGTMESLKGKVTVTWLLHLIRLDILYKNKSARWKVRFAWKKVTGGMKTEEATEKAEETTKIEVGEKAANIEKAEPAVSADKKVKGECPNEQKETVKMAEDMEKPQKKTENDQSTQKKQEKTEKADKKNKSLYEKIEEWIQKIKCTFRRVCDKIKLMLEKKDKIAAFLQDEQHKKAFFKAKGGVHCLLKCWKPKIMKATVVYGFEDPYITGKVLAGLAVLYPFAGDDVEVIPDFENKVLKGKVYIKGHVRMNHLAALACKLLLSKAVWKTYKDIRNFKL